MNEVPILTSRACDVGGLVTFPRTRIGSQRFPLGTLALSVLPWPQSVRKIVMIRVVQTLRVLPVEVGELEDTEYGFV